jgi:hypothetical protein
VLAVPSTCKLPCSAHPGPLHKTLFTETSPCAHEFHRKHMHTAANDKHCRVEGVPAACSCPCAVALSGLQALSARLAAAA